MKTMILLTISTFFLLQVTAAETGCTAKKNATTMADTSDCGAIIEYDIEDNQISIQGVYHNSSDEEVAIMYRLTIEKKGKSGTSNNSQGGQKEIPAQAKAVLSSTGLDYDPANYYHIQLQIMDASHQVICEVNQELSE